MVKKRLSAMMRVGAMVLGAMLMAPGAMAQMANPYGPNVTLETAKKIADAALLEAQKNGWTMAAAVTDTGGNLVYFAKLEGTQVGSANVSIAKSRSAGLFKRPTKAFQDVLAAGGEGLRILALDGAVPIEGGLPVLVDGKIVGAIGVSGGTSAQDGLAARAGLDMLK
jgi:uncharacterized protein GlcG (DUF336 family)